MMTSKEALESIKHFVSCNHPQESVYLCDTPAYKEIEKDLESAKDTRLLLLSYGIDGDEKLEETLKAFEIIKKLSGDEIRVLFNFLSFDNMDFTDFVGYIGDEYSIFITEEEFNLLKEALKK